MSLNDPSQWFWGVLKFNHTSFMIPFQRFNTSSYISERLKLYHLSWFSVLIQIGYVDIYSYRRCIVEKSCIELGHCRSLNSQQYLHNPNKTMIDFFLFTCFICVGHSFDTEYGGFGFSPTWRLYIVSYNWGQLVVRIQGIRGRIPLTLKDRCKLKLFKN